MARAREIKKVDKPIVKENPFSVSKVKHTVEKKESIVKPKNERHFAITYSINFIDKNKKVTSFSRDQLAVSSVLFPSGSKLRGYILDSIKKQLPDNVEAFVVLEYFIEFKTKEDFDSFQS